MHYGKQVALALLTLSLSGILYAQSDQDKAIIDRIAPVGSTCMVGDPCASQAASASSSAAKTPKDIFDAHCTACHTAGVAGAPKFGNAADWAPRIKQGKQTLYDHALHGFNSMPAKGLCMDCTDDEIKATVDYMVNAAQK